MSLGSAVPATPLGESRLRPHQSRSAPAIVAPGPGYYSPDKLRLKGSTPKATFPTAKRFNDDEAQATPGPGYFQKTASQDFLVKNHAGTRRRQMPFNMMARNLLTETKKTPGPLDYRPMKPHGHAYSVSFVRERRFKKAADNTTPGPADYRKTMAELKKLSVAPRGVPFSAVPRGRKVKANHQGGLPPAEMELRRAATGTSPAASAAAASPLAQGQPGQGRRQLVRAGGPEEEGMAVKIHYD
eukprot:TRINITY_DN10554_c0_g1_i1.p1 TRINITY_DN10554_c0_g1~~TRINITY_DN10554_c0_g1_i1.p1  ORF type:complete len:242 (+),score=49.74 TRINITY_DN10554_c0_g1_i1:94-819(+)